MVRLQKHKAYTYKSDSGKKIEHFKHLIVIPEEAIENLEWQEGQELNVTIKGNSLILSTDNISQSTETKTLRSKTHG